MGGEGRGGERRGEEGMGWEGRESNPPPPKEILAIRPWNIQPLACGNVRINYLHPVGHVAIIITRDSMYAIARMLSPVRPSVCHTGGSVID